MPNIEFRTDKVLKLNNVLSKKILGSEIANYNKHLQMLMNWVKVNKYETVGPLVIYSSGIAGVDNANNPKIEADLMIQLKQEKAKVEVPYYFRKELRITDCLLARFDGEPDNLRFASMKCALYAYENDLELTGETYTVFVKQEENHIVADVFMPVKQRTTEIDG
jgi:effector-binding domain-containing protein